MPKSVSPHIDSIISSGALELLHHDPNQGSLQLSRDDATANAPEYDRDANAPEIDFSSDSPEVPSSAQQSDQVV